ncbi:MAG: pyridoxine 5'-phosphate synthase [Candidatus Cloacimonetes bacterium]|nr:pyridoxine 5'-phosphate synthase [Candidatus Cloacimonadota bacterium]
MALLGVNIDHIATIRQARLGIEPEPLHAALIAQQNGADQITVHLREDRRHIQIRDVKMLRGIVQTKLNLEMALTTELIAIAKSIKPDTVTLVPEKREELTTEGGLNLNIKGLEDSIKELIDNGIEVSLFVEPDLEIIKTADRLKVQAVEIHTGTYANAKDEQDIKNELARIYKASKAIKSAGMRVVAGHGINYHNVFGLTALNIIEEYNIGHSIVSRAVFTGLAEAVSTMKKFIS